MDTERILAFTDGAFRSCTEVAAFVQQVVRPVLEPIPESDRKNILLGQVLRIQAWLGTLGKLNHPADFQAALCAERSLFEVTIDAILLGSKTFMEDRVLAWEQSAKLKQVDAAIGYYERLGQPIPEARSKAFERFQRLRSSIEQSRAQLGWKRHPDRWTGRGLLEDARAADKLENNFRFEEWYETRYREVCWNVHSSAFVMRSLDKNNFPAMMMVAFKMSADLAVVSARWVLRGVDLWTSDIEAQFELLHKQRLLAFASAVPGMADNALRTVAARGSTEGSAE